jgi:hypothetical protein
MATTLTIGSVCAAPLASAGSSKRIRPTPRYSTSETSSSHKRGEAAHGGIDELVLILRNHHFNFLNHELDFLTHSLKVGTAFTEVINVNIEVEVRFLKLATGALLELGHAVTLYHNERQGQCGQDKLTKDEHADTGRLV